MRITKNIVGLAATMSFGLLATNSFSQDVHFSQFWNNPLQINPANAGVLPSEFRANLGYRNQWNSVTTPFKTYFFEADYLISMKGSADLGVGLNVYKDEAGDSKFGTTYVQGALSGIVHMDRYQFLSLGVIGGLMQKSMDPTALIWDNQYQGGTYNPGLDPGESFMYEPQRMGDITAGLVYCYHSEEGYMTANDQFNMRIGAAYHHINRAKAEFSPESFDTLYRNLVVHADFQIGIGNSRWTMMPGFLAMRQGPATEVVFGTLARLRLQEASKITGFVKGAYMYLGTHYRWGDAFIPSLMLQFDKYQIGFSYDINVSKLAAASNGRGGFELTLQFISPNQYLYKKGHKTMF